MTPFFGPGEERWEPEAPPPQQGRGRPRKPTPGTGPYDPAYDVSLSAVVERLNRMVAEEMEGRAGRSRPPSPSQRAKDVKEGQERVRRRSRFRIEKMADLDDALARASEGSEGGTPEPDAESRGGDKGPTTPRRKA